MSKKVRIGRGGQPRIYIPLSDNQGRYDPGEWVETPQGKGFIDDRVTEGTVDGDEATDNSPIYVVGLVDGGVVFYRASDLDAADPPETDVEDPVSDVKEANNVTDNADEVVANDWTMPESWRESETPARLILLDAWTSMGAQFDCGGACCMGELKSQRLCAAMKDEALGTEQWRGGWAD